jgi:hypothetical protein
MRRSIFVAAIAMLISILIAVPALAQQCTNGSKSDPMAGAQVLIGAQGQILWAGQGVLNLIEQGILSQDGEGFHGIVAFDLDGDGVADASTWLGVGSEGEIPFEAQYSF